MASRFYQITESGEPFYEEDIGHLLKLCGVVFEGMGQKVVILTPDSLPPQTKNTFWFYQYDVDGWARILNHSNDPKLLLASDELDMKPWHRKVRYVISGLVQQKVWARDNFTCQGCEKEMGDVQLTVDHWNPLELGGANDTTNYISLCRACNKDKGNTHPREWCAKRGYDFDRLDALAKSGV